MSSFINDWKPETTESNTGCHVRLLATPEAKSNPPRMRSKRDTLRKSKHSVFALYGKSGSVESAPGLSETSGSGCGPGS